MTYFVLKVPLNPNQPTNLQVMIYLIWNANDTERRMNFPRLQMTTTVVEY